MENNQNNYLRLFCGKQRNGKQHEKQSKTTLFIYF